MKLLVVDDNKYVVYGLKEQLKWNVLGIDEIFGCYSVEQAREILLQHPIDFIISDIEMPGEDGFALLQWLKERDMDIDTVLLTSYAEFHYAQEAIRYQCFAYLLKPVESEQLEEVVMKLVERRLEKKKLEELIEFGDEWMKHRESIREMFWWDVVEDTLAATEEELKKRIEKERLPYAWDDCFRAAQICFEPQKEEKNWSRDLLGFCCENVLTELIQKMPASVECVCHSGYFQFTVVFLLEKVEYEECVTEVLKQFLELFIPFYHSDIRCFVSNVCTIASIEEHLRRLEEICMNKKDTADSITEECDYAEWDTPKNAISVQSELRVERIQEYIIKHLDTVTRNEISEKFYLSPNYLSKFFHRESGISLSEYIQKERMKLARQLLRENELSISQVAEQTGYPSFAHFSKQFKKFVGMTPNEYRKNKKNKKKERQK